MSDQIDIAMAELANQSSMRQNIRDMLEDIRCRERGLADVVRNGLYDMDRTWVEDQFDSELKADNGNMSMSLKGDAMFVLHPSELLSMMGRDLYCKWVRRFASEHLKLEDGPSYREAAWSVESAKATLRSYCDRNGLEFPPEVI